MYGSLGNLLGLPSDELSPKKGMPARKKVGIGFLVVIVGFIGFMAISVIMYQNNDDYVDGLNSVDTQP